MKIRIFKRLINNVFDVRVQTEDWSENDRELMVKYGEPEINLGGYFDLDTSDSSSSSGGVTLDDIYVRIMTESPFTEKFDARDYGSTSQAKAMAALWADTIEERITSAIDTLREKGNVLTTEEVVTH